MQDLSEQLEREINQLDIPESPQNLYDPLRYFLKLGGKRIRPLLTVLAAELFGKSFQDSVHASLAIEYFHNFSLIHDDIMDEAPLRRSQPSIHIKWNTNIAILAGDVLLVKAYQELCKQDAKHIPQLLEVFNKTAVEVCEGQQMDMDFELRNDISIQEYIEMIRLKTSVLLGCALELGAIISDSSEEDRKLIYDFGENIGIAFQIQDDLLDLYADPDKFGKQVGGDIIANKKTILLLKACEMGSAAQNKRISEMLEMENTHQKLGTAIHLFEEIGAKDEILGLRNEYYSKASHALESISVPDENKKKLLELVDFLKDRQM